MLCPAGPWPCAEPNLRLDRACLRSRLLPRLFGWPLTPPPPQTTTTTTNPTEVSPGCPDRTAPGPCPRARPAWPPVPGRALGCRRGSAPSQAGACRCGPPAAPATLPAVRRWTRAAACGAATTGRATGRLGPWTARIPHAVALQRKLLCGRRCVLHALLVMAAAGARRLVTRFASLRSFAGALFRLALLWEDARSFEQSVRSKNGSKDANLDSTVQLANIRPHFVKKSHAAPCQAGAEHPHSAAPVTRHLQRCTLGRVRHWAHRRTNGRHSPAGGLTRQTVGLSTELRYRTAAQSAVL